MPGDGQDRGLSARRPDIDRAEVLAGAADRGRDQAADSKGRGRRDPDEQPGAAPGGGAAGRRGPVP